MATNDPNDRPRFRRYAIATAVLAVLIGILPYPGPGILRRSYVAITSPAPIAVVGTSTMLQVSACDSDKRNVITMLAEQTGRPVTDLSIGGQHLIESINMAALAGLDGKATDVVLPLAYPYIDDWTTPPFRRLAFFKLLMPSFPVFAAEDRRALLDGLSGETVPVEQGYSFEGRRYAPYNVLASNVFAFEKEHQTCPETVTHDWDFTRTYFWWTHVAKRGNASLPPLVADLAGDLRRRGKRLHVVMLPVNLALIGKLDPHWPAIVRAGQAAVVDALRGRGVDVLDLADGFGEDLFMTEWCACVHLNENGRARLAAAIAQDLRMTGEPTRTSAKSP